MDNNYRNRIEEHQVLQGITLLEVVCGIALSAVLLSTLILAHSDHAQQIYASSLRHKAIHALDSYLTLVIQDKAELDVSECSNFEYGEHQWKICVRETGLPKSIAETDYRLIRVEIFLNNDNSIKQSQAMTSVELLQPIHENNE